MFYLVWFYLVSSMFRALRLKQQITESIYRIILLEGTTQGKLKKNKEMGENVNIYLVEKTFAYRGRRVGTSVVGRCNF